MKIHVSWLLSIICLTLPTGQLAAIEELDAAELAEHCKAFPSSSSSSDGQFCIRYIQGFIDGAIATDERVMINLEAKLNRKETFSERAVRTRATSSDLRTRAALLAEYCLGDPIPLNDVVAKVVADLNKNAMGADRLAREIVYSSLRTHYPCVRRNK